MPSHVKLEVIGHVGSFKYFSADITKNHKSFCTFGVSVSYPNHNKDDKANPYITTWYSIMASEWKADMMQKKFVKGMLVMVTGRPVIDHWTHRDGMTRTYIKMNAHELIILERSPKAPQPDVDPSVSDSMEPPMVDGSEDIFI